MKGMVSHKACIAFERGAGLSLQELAGKTGLSLPYLSRVENDKANISVVNLRLIANALESPWRRFLWTKPNQQLNYPVNRNIESWF